MTDVFIASNLDTAYPRKLQKPSTVKDTVRDTADIFILDSGIGDDTTNAEVLDLAAEYDADYVIGKDYLHDHARTTDSIGTFLDAFESHPCQATPMIPLQPPHADHYRKVTDAYGKQSHYVLGGMAVRSCQTKAQLRHITAFDRVVHDNTHIHALGVGGGKEFVRRIAPTGIIDSVDCSTPELAAANGAVINPDLQQKTVRIHNGEGVRDRNRQLAAFNSWQLQDAWTRDAAQSVATAQTSLCPRDEEAHHGN